MLHQHGVFLKGALRCPIPRALHPDCVAEDSVASVQARDVWSDLDDLPGDVAADNGGNFTQGTIRR